MQLTYTINRQLQRERLCPVPDNRVEGERTERKDGSCLTFFGGENKDDALVTWQGDEHAWQRLRTQTRSI